MYARPPNHVPVFSEKNRPSPARRPDPQLPARPDLFGEGAGRPPFAPSPRLSTDAVIHYGVMDKDDAGTRIDYKKMLKDMGGDFTKEALAVELQERKKVETRHPEDDFHSKFLDRFVYNIKNRKRRRKRPRNSHGQSSIALPLGREVVKCWWWKEEPLQNSVFRRCHGSNSESKETLPLRWSSVAQAREVER